MKVYIAQSVDGYIADKNHSVDWLEAYNEEIVTCKESISNSYMNFIKNIDTTISGSKTYDYLSSLNIGNPYQDYNNYVVTRDKNKYNDETVTGFINLDQLKELPISNKTWVVGGSQVIDYLLKHNKISEIIIFQIPILLGDGVKLFSNSEYINKLELLNVDSDKDFIQFHYKVKN